MTLSPAGHDSVEKWEAPDAHPEPPVQMCYHAGVLSFMPRKECSHAHGSSILKP
jgi:hypothetical protein